MTENLNPDSSPLTTIDKSLEISDLIEPGLMIALANAVPVFLYAMDNGINIDNVNQKLAELAAEIHKLPLDIQLIYLFCAVVYVGANIYTIFAIASLLQRKQQKS